MNENDPIKEEMDFRDILKNPVRLFGYSYFYFLAVIVIAGLYYVGSLDQISRNSIPPRLQASEPAEPDLPLRAAADIPPVNVTEISVPTAELVDRGRQLYTANCSSCHGDGGLGDGAAGVVMNPKPRSFLQADGWVNGRKVSEMYRTLEEGILESGMPSYNHMIPTDRFALIHYVRAFAGDYPADSEEELLELDTAYNLAEGTKQAAQIPVKIAIRRVLEESRAKTGRAEYILTQLQNGPQGRDADLFARVCRDQARAAAFLAAIDPVSFSRDGFVRAVTAAPLDCGFDAKVLQLNRAEWEQLYEFCVVTLRGAGQ